jgi:hypothetical protein
MKLSEAIILGSMMKPQISGSYYSKDGTCALGAALDAVGRLHRGKGGPSGRLLKIWPWLTWHVSGFKCKACGTRRPASDMQDVVIHMNDGHKRSRESIASWVAEIENDVEKAIRRDPFTKFQVSDLESHIRTRVKKSVTHDTDERKDRTECHAQV